MSVEEIVIRLRECADALEAMAGLRLERLQTRNMTVEQCAAYMGRTRMARAVRAPQPAGRWMNVTQCAAYIGRTKKAIYNLVAKGQIPCNKPGGKLQFDREKVDRWMERHAKRGRMVG